MYELSVEGVFCAAHALLLGGVREPLHGHNWHVVVTIRGERLDAEGLVFDFHQLERELRVVTDRLNNTDLTTNPVMGGKNPSAEVMATFICDELTKRLDGTLPAGVAIDSVRITESPGCAATYRPRPTSPTERARS